jgi:hypothetical protein
MAPAIGHFRNGKDGELRQISAMESGKPQISARTHGTTSASATNEFIVRPRPPLVTLFPFLANPNDSEQGTARLVRREMVDVAQLKGSIVDGAPQCGKLRSIPQFSHARLRR